jgi:hypothetical protein
MYAVKLSSALPCASTTVAVDPLPVAGVVFASSAGSVRKTDEDGTTPPVVVKT